MIFVFFTFWMFWDPFFDRFWDRFLIVFGPVFTPPFLIVFRPPFLIVFGPPFLIVFDPPFFDRFWTPFCNRFSFFQFWVRGHDFWVLIVLGPLLGGDWHPFQMIDSEPLLTLTCHYSIYYCWKWSFLFWGHFFGLKRITFSLSPPWHKKKRNWKKKLKNGRSILSLLVVLGPPLGGPFLIVLGSQNIQKGGPKMIKKW